jgi:protoheme IX farnesyltransferase
VVAGERETRRLIVLYSAVLVAASFAPVALGLSGLPYGLSAAILGGLFLLRAWRLWREESRQAARGLFGFSILYLFLIFFTLLADRVAAGFL